MTDLNPALRTIRLLYRMTKTQWFIGLIEGLSFFGFLIFVYYVLVFACVGLHGADVCFN